MARPPAPNPLPIVVAGAFVGQQAGESLLRVLLARVPDAEGMPWLTAIIGSER
jgi:hypothetical protein